MKKLNNIISKKFIAIAAGFILLIATVAGILFGTNRNAFAQTPGDVRSDTQKFAVNSPQTVTDDGVNKNGYIIFNCDRPFDDIPTYKDLGYKYVTVSLEFQMRELYDGYQHIYLYSGVNGHEVYHAELTYYGNRKIDVYHTVIVDFTSLPLEEFAPKNGPMNLCIRFDASGVGKDTWQYQNMDVTVQVSQNMLRGSTYIADYR